MVAVATVPEPFFGKLKTINLYSQYIDYVFKTMYACTTSTKSKLKERQIWNMGVCTKYYY